MEDAEKELWKAMRRYIAVGLEVIRNDQERLAAIRRELAELPNSDETRNKLAARLLDVDLY